MEVGVENSKLLIFLVTNPHPETIQEPTKSPLIRTQDSSSYHLGHYKYSVPGMGGKGMVRQGPWYIFSVISLCISKVSLITQLERIFFSKLSLLYSHCSTDLAASKTLLYDYAYPCLVKHWVSWNSRSVIWISFVFIWYQIFNEYLLTEHLFIFVCMYTCIHNTIAIHVFRWCLQSVHLCFKDNYQYLFYIAYRKWVFSLGTVPIWRVWNFVSYIHSWPKTFAEKGAATFHIDEHQVICYLQLFLNSSQPYPIF